MLSDGDPSVTLPGLAMIEGVDPNVTLYSLEANVGEPKLSKIAFETLFAEEFPLCGVKSKCDECNDECIGEKSSLGAIIEWCEGELKGSAPAERDAKRLGDAKNGESTPAFLSGVDGAPPW